MAGVSAGSACSTVQTLTGIGDADPHDVFDQVIPGGEVVVDGCCVQIRPFGDVREAQSRIPFRAEHVGGRVEDPPPRLNRFGFSVGLILMRGRCDTRLAVHASRHGHHDGQRRRHCCAVVVDAQLLPPACRPGPCDAPLASRSVFSTPIHAGRHRSQPRAHRAVSAPRARCARIAAMVREADDRDRGRTWPVRQCAVRCGLQRTTARA
jgi:hypothetical protein